MSDGAKVRGTRANAAALDALFGRVERATFIATTQAAAFMERTGKRKLRTYTHPEGTPTTSPPGQPPALVTGNLRRSWRSTPARAGRKPHTVVAYSGPTAVYSRIQELGGQVRIERRDGSVRVVTLPARPYVAPTLESVRLPVRRIYVRRWTEAILT
jgi:hypothetical protein